MSKQEQLSVVPGGRSKETILVSLSGTDELPDQVILRKDRPVGVLANAAADEFAVIKAVHDFGGVPIPEPFFAEEEGHGLGRGHLRADGAGARDAKRASSFRIWPPPWTTGPRSASSWPPAWPASTPCRSTTFVGPASTSLDGCDGGLHRRGDRGDRGADQRTHRTAVRGRLSRPGGLAARARP